MAWPICCAVHAAGMQIGCRTVWRICFGTDNKGVEAYLLSPFSHQSFPTGPNTRKTFRPFSFTISWQAGSKDLEVMACTANSNK